MGNQELSTTEALQALDTASVHLQEAEEVFWDLSNNLSSTEAAEELDEVVEELWKLQNKTAEIQQSIASNHAEFAWDD